MPSIEAFYCKKCRTFVLLEEWDAAHGRCTRHNKFSSRKVHEPGVTFDSQKEHARAQELRLLERAGVITDLKFHTKYPLEVNGFLIGVYTDDASYVEEASGKRVIEDTKSPATRKLSDYRLRKKLMQALYGISIQEV